MTLPGWVFGRLPILPAVFWAFVCSFSCYIVPVQAGVAPGLPLFLSVIGYLLMAGSDFWRLLPIIAGWHLVIFGAWLLFWSTSRWLRYLLAAPVVVALTMAPVFLEESGPMSPEKVAEIRPRETGDWEEICRLDGYEISDQNSRTALEQGQAWIYRVRGRPTSEELHEYSLFSPAVCEVTAAPWVRRSNLVDGGPRGRALWLNHDEDLFFSSPEQPEPVRLEAPATWFGGRVILSPDGDWVVWTEPYTPQKRGWLFVVRRTTDRAIRVVPLELPLQGSYSARPLEYDPAREELRLDADGYLVTVDRNGRPKSALFRPDGCNDEWLGRFRVHPKGWVFSGSVVEDCDLVWGLGPSIGEFDGRRYSGQLPEYGRLDLQRLALNSSGTLLGGDTSFFLGHHYLVHDSVLVIRLSDGAEMFRRHLEVSEHRTVAVFLGPYFAFSDSGSIRVFRVPDELP